LIDSWTLEARVLNCLGYEASDGYVVCDNGTGESMGKMIPARNVCGGRLSQDGRAPGRDLELRHPYSTKKLNLFSINV